MSIAYERERCEYEIRKRIALLRNGAIPEETEGILQGLQDWSAELRILNTEVTP